MKKEDAPKIQLSEKGSDNGEEKASITDSKLQTDPMKSPQRVGESNDSTITAMSTTNDVEQSSQVSEKGGAVGEEKYSTMISKLQTDLTKSHASVDETKDSEGGTMLETKSMELAASFNLLKFDIGVFYFIRKWTRSHIRASAFYYFP